MGTAVYYLKADFPTGVDMECILEKAKKALVSMSKFQDRWQELRDRSSGTPAQRVDLLKAEFPQVWIDFNLDTVVVKPDDESLNCFAGEVDITEEMRLDYRGNQIRLSDEVWHFADWTRIEDYFKSLGATKASSISDEYSTPFDDW
jgi:hypothetical protein